MTILIGTSPISANAQSSVTIYGTVSAAINYATHTNPTGDRSMSMQPGTIDATNFWGLVGNEDLGSGMSAHFKVESPFNLNNGAQSVAGFTQGFFGSEASMGMTTPVGRFDMGRLNTYGSAAEPLALGDPVHGGGITIEDVWPVVYSGTRFDNAIRYRIHSSGVTIGAMYAFGGQTDTTLGGHTLAGTLGYEAGPVMVLGSYQTTKQNTGKTNNVMSIGGTYTIGKITASGSYMHVARDSGFSGINNSGFIANSTESQKLNFFEIGLSWRATQFLTWKSAYSQGIATGSSVLGVPGNGKIQTIYSLIDYSLSKRTIVVAGLNFNKWTGSYSGYWGSSIDSGQPAPGNPATNGSDTRFNITIGMAHSF
ncbi:porin [Burkholderia metallica]|uniref:porin n=1 Tax=Burkholderia metallica TaxID=488729 RepID=UPI001CF398FE|nr:porin [Burkholderia metallica]MCA8023646.1 porin [Burkholderia metallica]